MNVPEKHTAAIVCGPVFRSERDVRLVTHDRDGWWQFLCGRSDCCDEKDARILGLGHLIERDPTLEDVLDLELGRCAERASKAAAWIKGVTASDQY